MPRLSACHPEIRIRERSHPARSVNSTMPRDQSSFTGLSLPAAHTHRAFFILSITPGTQHAARSGTRLRCGIQFAIVMASVTHQRCAFAIPRTTAIRPLPFALPSARREHLIYLHRCLKRPVTGKIAILRPSWEANLLIFHNSKFTYGNKLARIFHLCKPETRVSVALFTAM